MYRKITKFHFSTIELTMHNTVLKNLYCLYSIHIPYLELLINTSGNQNTDNINCFETSVRGRCDYNDLVIVYNDVTIMFIMMAHANATDLM